MGLGLGLEPENWMGLGLEPEMVLKGNLEESQQCYQRFGAGLDES